MMLTSLSRTCPVVLTLVLALLGLPAPGSNSQESWQLFHGNPQQTGVAASRLPDRLEVLWTFKAGDSIENAVAVVGEQVFVASMDEHVYSLDRKTGKQRWKFKTAPFKAAPAVEGSSLYIGDIDGVFHCLDTASGMRKWKFEAGSEIGGANFHGQSVLFGSQDEHLYCLGQDGKLRWKFKIDGPIYGCPAVAEGKTFLVGCDSQLHVLDVSTGKEERSVDLGGQTGATAAVLGDQLFVGTMRHEVKAIDWKKGGISWTFKPGRGTQGFFSSPAITSQYVVIGGRDNRIHNIERKSGKGLWSFPTGNKVDSSPVIAGSRVVVGSQDGNLYVLDLEKGSELQRVKLDAATNATPVVVDGMVLIGTQNGTLYCLGAKK